MGLHALPRSGTGRTRQTLRSSLRWCTNQMSGSVCQPGGAPAVHWRRRCSSNSESRVKHVSTKLLVLLLACLACGSAVLGYINIRLHRHDLEQVSLEQAIGISDFVRDNTYRSMMANDRQGLYEAIQGIGNHSEIEQDSHHQPRWAGGVLQRLARGRQPDPPRQHADAWNATREPISPRCRSSSASTKPREQDGQTPGAGRDCADREQAGMLQRRLPRPSGIPSASWEFWTPACH